MKSCAALSNDEAARSAASSLTTEMWLWAEAIVKSRALKVPDIGRGNFRFAKGTFIDDDMVIGEDAFKNLATAPLTSVLVPLADMINHQYLYDGKDSALCDWGLERPKFNGSPGAFVIKSRGFIKSGKELSISYGNIAASGSLLNYGFVPTVPKSLKTWGTQFDYAVLSLHFDELLSLQGVQNGGHKSRQEDVWMRDEDNLAFRFPILPRRESAEKGRRELLLSISGKEGSRSLLSL